MAIAVTPTLKRANDGLDAIKIQFSRLRCNVLARNVGAFVSAEASNRLTRIFAMVFAARALTPEMFGLAAIVLTSHELIKVLTNNGIGQKIIVSRDEELESVCHRAQQLNVIICLGAALAQSLAGIFLAILFSEPALLFMCLSLSFVFVGMPLGLVRIFRSARRNEMRLIAKVSHRQVSADNLLTLILAVFGFGAWALVLPKALVMPIWVVGARRVDDWRHDPTVRMASVREMWRYCSPVIVTEALKASRYHLDKAVIVAVLGIEALGIYFFAVNAGLGLATALSRVTANCLMPFICTEARKGGSPAAAWKKTMPLVIFMGTLVFILQAAAAPVYVPWIFGNQWSEYAILVAILCLAATPRLVNDCCSQLVRALGLTRAETTAAAVTTAISISALWLGCNLGGLPGAAAAIVLAAWLAEPAAAFWLYRKACGS